MNRIIHIILKDSCHDCPWFQWSFMDEKTFVVTCKKFNMNFPQRRSHALFSEDLAAAQTGTFLLCQLEICHLQAVPPLPPKELKSCPEKLDS